MTSHESHAVAGMEWSVGGSDQTLISITNASARPDVLTAQLFTARGAVDLPALELRGGEIALLNMRAIAARVPIGATFGTFAVRGSHGSRSAFRLERLMVTPAFMTAEGGQNASDDPVAYVDTEGEERVLWIRTDAIAPEQSDAFPPEEAYVTLRLTTMARWSSGASATTDETDTTEYFTDDTDTLTVQQPPQPRVTVFIPIHRPPNVG